MSTSIQKQKGKTKHVRLPIKWHRFMKVEAAQRDISLTRLLVGALENYFGIESIESYEKKS